MINIRRFFGTLFLLSPLVCVGPSLFTSDFAESLETKLTGLWFDIRGAAPVPKSVTIVRIDSRSLRRLGPTAKQSLDLAGLAAAVERIAAAGPKLIVLDTFFARPSTSAEGNEKMQVALRSAPTVIARSILTYIDTDLAGRQHLDLERTIPAAVFARAAAEVIPLMANIGTGGVVSKISIASEDIAVPLEPVPLLGPLRRYVSPEIAAPGYYDLINYYGPPYFVPDVPIYQLLLPDESVPDEYFRNRVVFIGSVDLPDSNPDGGDDTFLTPISKRRMSGVEIHATIAQNLLDGTWIKRFPPLPMAGLQTLIACFFVILLKDAGVRRGLAAYLACVMIWALASYFSFTRLHFFVPGALLFGVGLPALLAGWAIWLAMKPERRSSGA